MKKALSLLLVALTASVAPVFADTMSSVVGGITPGAINIQNSRDLRIHEAQTRAKYNSAIVKPKTEVEKPVIPNVVGELKSVTFVNNTNFTSSQLNAIIKDQLNQPMSIENISLIRRNLMKFYQQHGFYSAVPVIVSQNDKTGELVIEMNEGSKNSITFE
jgi:hemolysin activation/secretion protein